MKRKSLLFLLLMTLFVPLAMHAQTLLVHDGTETNRYVPFYGYYADEDQQNQMIYPATELTAMNGNAITQMVFYYSSTGSYGSGVGTWTVSLGETTATTLDGLDETTVLTTVFTGGLDALFNTTDKTLTIAFNNEYTYNGGNLLVEFSHSAGSYKDYYFYGETVTGASYCYDGQRNFLPKTTFSYEAPASCPRPTLGEAQNITEEGASFQWTENGSATEWVLQYSTTSDFTNATSLNRSGIPALAISGLSSATTYYVRLKSVCGPGDESDWSNIVSFVTKQTAVAVGNGWSDDFEGNVNWIMVNGGNNAWVIGTAVNNGGDKAMYVSNDGGTSNAYTVSGVNMVYATKLMTFETGQYIFTYDWQAYGEGSYDYIRAWLAPSTFVFTANQLPDGTTSTYYYTSTTPTGWIALDGGSKLNLQSSWQNKSVTVDVTAGDYLVVFMWGNDTSGGSQPPAAIDNFEITKVMCAAPSAFAATDVTAHTATLNWTSDGSAWQVAYTNDATIDPDNLTPDASRTNSYQLTGLTPETPYYAYVRTDCGGTYSAWVSTTFTTTVACPAPTSLACTALTATTATLSWTETGEASDWVVEYGTAQDFTGATSVNVSTTASVNLTGLTAETVYYARVKADCGGGDASAWSATASFEPTNKTVIGTAATTNQYVPTYVLYNYSLTQQIYTAAELGGANAIFSIDFYCGSNGTKTRDFNIYMVSTNKSSFASTTDWITVTANDLVFSATGYTWHQGWNTFELDNPFIYDGTSNVAIIFDDNAGQWESSYNFAAFEATEQALRVYNDDTNYDPMNPSSYTGTVMDVKNQIRVLKGEAPSCFQPTYLTVADVTTSSATLSWTGDARQYNVQYRPVAKGEVYESINFDNNSMGGWTTIDADGDGFEWVLGSACDGVYLDGGNLGGTGHNSSADLMTSGSFTNIDLDGDEYGDALTPDNWLVSPQVTLGGSVSFWACAQDASWNAEHFGVAVSTTGNTNAADFTTIQSWTMTAKGMGAKVNPGTTRSGNRAQGTWYEYTVDLSDYAGETGYVAIRHFDCSDQFMLNVDDIVITGPAPEPEAWTDATVDENSLALTGLDSDTEYEWQVQAVCDVDDESNWAVGANFTTLSNCAVPSNLEATAMVEDATLTWEGAQDSYNLRYRKPSTTQATPGSFFNDFESGALTGWTVVRNDAGTDYTDWHVVNSETLFSSGAIPAHSGSYVVMSRSWNSSDYSVDNWLISPEVTLDGALSYWVMDDGSWHEHYDVYVSTTDTELSSFTLLYEPGEASEEWTQHTVDLRSFEGVLGYIAFRHTDEGQDYLFIDDVLVGSMETVEYSWEEMVVSDATTVDLARLDANTEYEWQVQGINASCTDGVTEWSELSTFTTHDYCDAPENFEFDITFNSATVTWTGYQDSYNVLYRTAAVDELFYEDFSGDIQWTGSGLNSNYTFANLNTDDDPWIFFGFYGDGSTQTLISPELEEATPDGSTLEFFYYAYQNSIQSFSVGFSSTDNDIDSFTFGDVYTNTADNYYGILSYDVPEGTKYFAIQSTGASNYLFVTDFQVKGPNYEEPGDIETMVVNTNSATLEPLDPGTKYEVYVSGICGEDEYTDYVGYYFTTDVFNETLELAEGWNWVSFYVETEDQDPIALLDMLKRALRENGLNIESAEYTTSFDGEEWFGDLDDEGIYPEEMYLIEVSNDCTIVLEGSPVDPTDHEITIESGYNWIGFPCSVETEVVVALADFDAEEGDEIEGAEGMTYYDGEEWFGDIETLVPGQGYTYYSASDETKPLIFQSAAKSRHANTMTAKLTKKFGKSTRSIGFKTIKGFDNQVKKQVKQVRK